jgi:transketolase
MQIDNSDLNLIANTIRTLAMDAVQKAKSGHPGMPMGCADIAAVLWTKILRYNPEDPEWINRDRFVLSAGHGSMLLYAVLHLAGYDISLDDIKQFRQWGSKTPGHPEYRHTPGVETTTGPLGQGFANAVGMSLASKVLADEFNRDTDIINHYVYAIVSDGDIMEGVSSEAASLAGHLGLGNIVFIYDSNDISIEGSTALTLSDDTEKRFTSYHWHVQKIDGHDFDAVEQSLINAQQEREKPSIIIAKTRIAKGSPNMEGSEKTHGAPIGEDEVRATKINIGCKGDETFCVPERVYDIFQARREELKEIYETWRKRFATGTAGGDKDILQRFYSMPDLNDLKEKLPSFDPEKAVATRSASGMVLETLFMELPNIIGGSADLAPSNKSFVKGFSESGRNTTGRNIHFGVREHAMGAILNGIAYYGGFIPYAATFLVFMDYMRPPIRLAAMSGLNTIYLFTHDSIFVGEDGPTHQPVEQLAAARAIPNLTVIRPADAEETREAWLAAIANTEGPTALILTRQDLPILKRDPEGAASNLHRGAYVIWDSGSDPDILLLSSGSEVNITIGAATELKKRGIMCRVISFPSWELFEKQDDEYRKKILPPGIGKRGVVEAGISMGWEKYAGRDALYLTIERFGASAPLEALAEKFGLTIENVTGEVERYLRG